MKFMERSRSIIAIVFLFLPLAVFSARPSLAGRMLNGADLINIYLRVEQEIMQKTPAGQYYDSLFWKYTDELNQIIDEHPEHQEELIRALILFAPNMKALLDGDGDRVYITSEQVMVVKTELNWFISGGSPALREDIQKEMQRLPLDHFVGMTMNQAWDFINSKWTPDIAAQPTKPSPTPPTSKLVKQQNLVPGSNGEWAYYVLDGVYFEYPTSYHYTTFEDNHKDSLTFCPIDPEKSCAFYVHVWNVPINEKDKINPNIPNPSDNIVSKHIFHLPEFEGIESISHIPNSSIIYAYAILYNDENQLAVDVLFPYQDDYIQTLDGPSYFTRTDQYLYFRHMIDKIHLQAP